MKRKSSFYIKDILNAIEKIEQFTGDIDFGGFSNDDKTSSAVIHKIEIIGEAVKQLPNEVKERYPGVPWSSMAKVRDKIIHFYHGVDYEIIWHIIKEDLPSLKNKLHEIYQTLREEEG